MARRRRKTETQTQQEQQPTQPEQSKDSVAIAVEKTLSIIDQSKVREMREWYEKWKSLPREEQVKKVKDAINYFIKLAERNQDQARIAFMKWLDTPYGFIMFADLWDSDLVNDIMRLMHSIFSMIRKIA